MSNFITTDHPRVGDGTFTDKANSEPEAALADAAIDLSDLMDFDHVITVGRDGTISDGNGLYAPEVYIDDGDPFWGAGNGWEVLRGFTGQQGYHGHVMHASEYIGGGLEDHIRQNPGNYAVVEVRDEDGGFPDGDPVGWAVAFKPLEPTLGEALGDLRGADFAGYTYEAENYRADALVELLIREGRLAPGARGTGAEEALNQLAGGEGVDRDDEFSFDSDDFPKTIRVEQLTDDDIDWLER